MRLICLVALALMSRLLIPTLPGADVAYNRDIRPILSGKCFHCHGQDDKSRKAKLRLDSFEAATKDKIIVPGNLEQSELIKRILTTDPDDIMPPPDEGHALTPKEIDLLKQWVQAGAKYESHWAFTPPAKTEMPPAGVHAVDHFIRKQLQAVGLSPAQRADQHTLVRRVALIITGLPPSSEEIAQFATDTSDAAYERMVDHFLSKPAYGENLARMWMDIARYADSAGYGSDPLRPDLWPWRDWVINAFNANKPFDVFSIEQLAGDLLPEATTNHIIATTFHRNTMTNTEGGTDDEEFRVAAIKDRIGTTMQGWMGLSFSCAQCHTHKFDPISQTDYYRFFAIFNQTADADRGNEEPTIPFYSKDQQQQITSYEEKIASLEHELKAGHVDELHKELAGLLPSLQSPATWTPVSAEAVTTSGKSKISKQDDGAILVNTPGKDKKETLDHNLAHIDAASALRLEALTHPTLPKLGPGWSKDGNAIISAVQVSVTRGPIATATAQYLRINLPGKDMHLQVSAIEVIDNNGQKIVLTNPVGSDQQPLKAGADGVISLKGKDPWIEFNLGQEMILASATVQVPEAATRDMRDSNLSLFNNKRRQVFSTTIKDKNSKQKNVEVTNVIAFSNITHDVPAAVITADFEQNDKSAASLLSKDDNAGWGFAGAAGKPHELVIAFQKPIQFASDERLHIQLTFDSANHHILGHYRFSVTAAAGPVVSVPAPIQEIATKTARSDTDEQKLIDFIRPFSTTLTPARNELRSTKEALKKVSPWRLPIMKELSEKEQRKTHFLNKGSYLSPGDEVTAALPTGFGNFGQAANPTRLDAAKWLFHADNPLTARVAANRFWAVVFGRGIVETQEDFGTQGTLPSNQALIDWLTVHFQNDLKWDIKAYLKFLLISDTFKQSARGTPLAGEKDPRNEYISHFPRRRLDGELIRDQALAISGLLNQKIGGPSVFPYQPDGLWKAAFNGQRNWKTSTDNDQYRRGLYTFWRRTVPYPALSAFDMPSREISTFRRISSNSPIQSFVTLNEPAFFETATAFARRIMNTGGTTTDERIRFAIQTALCRPAPEQFISIIRQLYGDQRADFSQNLDTARKLVSTTDKVKPTDDDVIEFATWTVIANVLLNLDDVLNIN